MKTFLFGVLASAALIAPVAAADLSTRPAPVVYPVAAPAGFDWSGFYVGAQVGYAWSKSSAPFFGLVNFDGNGRGAFGGLHLGYNWQMPSNIVLGIEADANVGGPRSVGMLPSGVTSTIAITNPVAIDWSGSVRARLGYAAGQFMPYVTGGLAFARVSHSLDVASTSFYSASAVQWGWTVGAGLEYAFSPNWSARVEYRYSDFGARSYQALDFDHTLSLRSHDVRVGVSYRF